MSLFNYAREKIPSFSVDEDSIAERVDLEQEIIKEYGVDPWLIEEGAVPIGVAVPLHMSYISKSIRHLLSDDTLIIAMDLAQHQGRLFKYVEKLISAEKKKRDTPEKYFQTPDYCDIYDINNPQKFNK